MKQGLFIFIVLLTACSPSRFVVPLARKERAVSISVGGPLIKESSRSIPYPIPNSSFTYGYGLTKKMTTYTSLYLSPIAYGIIQIEAGYLYEWYYNSKKKIGFTTNMQGNVMTDVFQWKTKFYPQLDANLYWHFMGDSHYHCDCPKDRGINIFVYLGLSSWLELNQSDFTGINEGFRLLVNPHFGLNAGSKRTKLNLEAKYYSPYIKVEQTGIPYYSPFGGYGALGLNLALYRLF